MISTFLRNIISTSLCHCYFGIQKYGRDDLKHGLHCKWDLFSLKIVSFFLSFKMAAVQTLYREVPCTPAWWGEVPCERYDDGCWWAPHIKIIHRTFHNPTTYHFVSIARKRSLEMSPRVSLVTTLGKHLLAPNCDLEWPHAWPIHVVIERQTGAASQRDCLEKFSVVSLISWRRGFDIEIRACREDNKLSDSDILRNSTAPFSCKMWDVCFHNPHTTTNPPPLPVPALTNSLA